MSLTSKTYLALDIGGTKIYGALYDDQWNILNDHKVPTEGTADTETVFSHIVEVVEAIKQEGTQAIGISWAGFVDAQSGKVLKAPNIPAMDGFLLTQRLEETCCLLYTSPSPRDLSTSRMPSSA